MDCLGTDVTAPDFTRAKRGRKLSLSLGGETVGTMQTVDQPKEEGVDRGCTGSLRQHQLPAKTPLPPNISSPPNKTLVLNASSANKSSPQQKQLAASRRRKTHDKKYLQENGASTMAGEPKKIAICERFFMPVSKKRKLLADETIVLTRSQGTERPAEEALKDVQAAVKARHSIPQQHFSKAKSSSCKASTGSSHVLESAIRMRVPLDTKEDGLRNGGIPIHPLFLRGKASATKAGTAVSESGYLEPCPPAHVTQYVEEGKLERKWADPSFRLTSPFARCNEEELIHRLIESGHSLKNDLLMSRLSIPISGKMKKLSDTSARCLPKLGPNHCDANQPSSFQRGLENLLEYLQQNTERRRKFFGVPVQTLPDRTMDDCTTIEKLQERFAWYNARRYAFLSDNDKGALSSQKNMLWTDVYQPKSSKEVCGNATGVEFLNNWLQSWRERMVGQVNGPDPSQKNTAAWHYDSDSDRGWFEDDSDTENGTDEESGLHSTLLVTGPSGCGKTAAIYACAAEQGLTVIEVSASSCRSGASLMQKFGRGGLESQAVGNWSAGEDRSSKEPDESLTIPHSSERISPKVPGKGKKEGKARGNASGSKNCGGRRGNSAVGRKLFDSSASDVCEENLGMGVEEPQPGSPQKKKKMTIILFEDVDLHFEEDRGFLTSLVQLAKKTKRPIILTSNSRQPGLPQILEKARIDFFYPSPEELTLHASLVCIAEGVACSPWMVNRLVGSCNCDIRKVIIALQFWRQDTCSSLMSSLNSTSWDSRTSSNSFENISESSVSEIRESRRRLSLRPRPPNSNALSSSLGEMENRLFGGERANAFKQWDSEARYLYDLDIHHIILPDFFSSNCPCLLSLDVASRISAAVDELEKHESVVAEKEAEQQGLDLQAQLDVAEAERKAWRRSKDAVRRASRTKTQVVEEGTTVFGSVSSSNDTENESSAIKLQLSGSPVKSIREARALARSPLRPKNIKLKRGLLCYDTENDEDGQDHAGGHRDGVAGVLIPHSGAVQVTGVHDSSEAAPTNVVITDDMEDKDVVFIPRSESVVPVRRKRLQKDFQGDLPGSEITLSMEVCSRAGIENEDVNLVAVTCSKGSEPVSSPQNLSCSPLSGTDINELLTSDGRHSVTGSVHRVEDQCVNQDGLSLHTADMETYKLDTRQSEVDTEKAKLLKECLVFDVDLNLKRCPCNNGAVGCVHANSVNICIPEDTLLGNVLEATRLEETGSTVIRASSDDETSGLSSGVENVPGAKKSGCLGVEDFKSLSSLPQVNLPGDVRADDTTEGGVLEETKCEFVNPVEEAWRTLRDERQALRHLLRPVQSSISESEAVATVLDVISASNTISSFSSESWKSARITFSGKWNDAFEGNIGHCSFWEGCQEIASHLVRAVLQTFSTASLVTFRDNKLPVALGILSAANDVPAVGKCIITYDDVSAVHNLASQLKTTDNTYSKAEITRQTECQERMEEIIRTRLLPRGRITGVSLLDYIAYLGRINQTEEERRSQTISDGKRSRRFRHHLSSKMSDTDIAEFGSLQRILKA